MLGDKCSADGTSTLARHMGALCHIHAMVYSVDAPTLEGEFHKHLQSQRVNLVNPRKEFFAVTMKELEEIVQEHGLQIELTKLAEAKEYRQSLSMRSAAGMQHGTPAPVVEEFPASL